MNPEAGAILLCGSRYWNDERIMRQVLGVFGPPDALLVHGDGPGVDGNEGADKMAGRIWADWGRPVRRVPAWWEGGKFQGPPRNTKMVNLERDGELRYALCVGLPLGESRGTYDCLTKATEAGIPTFKYLEPQQKLWG